MIRIFGSIALACAVFVGVVFADVVAWGLRPLSAATISFQISGTLSFVDGSGVVGTDDELAPEVIQGAPFIGILSYDLIAPTQDGVSSQSYKYAPPTGSMGLSITVGGQAFGTNPLSGFNIRVTNAVPDDPLAQVDQFFFVSNWLDPAGGFWEGISFSLVDSSGDAFSSAALPTMLSLVDFDVSPFSREIRIDKTSSVITNIYPPDPAVLYSLVGIVDTITLVPEPATLVLAGLGLFAWGVFLRNPKPPTSHSR